MVDISFVCGYLVSNQFGGGSRKKQSHVTVWFGIFVLL